MFNTRRTFLKGAVSLAGAAALPGIVKAADAQVINYGGSAWLGHYPAYIGIKSGLFAAKGLDVKWQSFGTSSARMSAMLSGGIDVACTGIVSALALMARGSKHFSIVGVPEDFGRVEGLFVRSGITSIQGLKGKKIGVTFASSSHMLVLDLLASAGLSPDRDVSLLNVPAPELPAAFQSNQIDAAAAWTPQFNRIRSMPDIKLLADDTGFSLYKQYGVTPGPDVLVMRRDFAGKNADAARKFLQAYFEACTMLRDKPDQAAKYLTELTNLTLQDQIATIKDATWYDAAQQKALLTTPGKYVDGLQKLAEMLVTHKQIDKAPAVRDWTNVNYL
ncbi:twin-arginine translocation signal domain-containing protein [Noviherbaspirillum cavernae]|uniref:Twin-arginine translocation signal domain-containing protein n=1 Tax=Noviherbaspirillum cavernae TaxID=2320862 RepID=A0A418WY51_9BURK|nr:ABC transporter substrate-binding protein [Noviherbaspirillum cavernae]RJG05015.1 twin-arginine translocation signal domain-containing protein [Noviherbaspirillum cavernae]